MALKVAVSGGGAGYTPELIEGVINCYRNLPVSDLCLADLIDRQETREIVGAHALRMVATASEPVNVSVTLDRREAIHGAQFVIIQIRGGRLPHRARDERIPLAYDGLGQESTGAGGFAKGLRTIPVTLDISEDIREVAPDVWVVNFTNPPGRVALTIHPWVTSGHTAKAILEDILQQNRDYLSRFFA